MLDVTHFWMRISSESRAANASIDCNAFPLQRRSRTERHACAMGRTKQTVRDKTSFQRRQQVEAALCAGAVAATGLLAILPRELLRLVIAAVVKARDARQLERLGATCKALWALCREEAPWQALLMAHFDVDHPDAYPILDGANAPREHLMWLVGEARDLTREYAENEVSNLPSRTAASIMTPRKSWFPGSSRASTRIGWHRSPTAFSWLVAAQACPVQSEGSSGTPRSIENCPRTGTPRQLSSRTESTCD